ncbi:Transcriptional regulatory protein ZraR [subsurface metagenome]
MDVRLLCATNEDLRNLISEGKFRKDFYYRINVVNIDIPPLRERREDIPLLALHFLKQYSEERNKHIQGIEDAALKALSDYDWKGNNVRELKNEIERLVIFSKGREEIKLSDLSEKFQTNVAPETSHEILINKSGKPKTYEEFEKEYVNYILSITDGNKAEAARIMGIPRSTLRGKIRKLNIGQ